MGKAMAKLSFMRTVVRHRMAAWNGRLTAKASQLRARVADEKGQGTTEYAILVGVLVVIAILAITVFRPKLQELWDAISSGINSL